jgi:Domain of unknown function (DUF4340)
VVEEKMKPRGLIVAVIILAALSGTLYWSQHRKPPAESAVPSSAATPIVIKVDPSSVTQLVIKEKGSEPVSLKKDEAGKWQITEPKPYRADQDAVAGVLSILSGLSADRVVEEKATDRKQYGLEEPAAEVDVTGKGQTRQLLLGDDTPTGGDIFVAVAGDPRVFTVSSYNKTSLAKSLNDLRDKNLLTLNADKVSRVELISKGQTLEFDRTKDGWQILKPSPSPADASAVNELVRSLTEARMDLTATGNAAADFADGTPVGTAKLTGDSGVQTLEVRKDNNDYYAKSSANEGIYKTDSSIATAMDKKPDDFIAKKKS